MRFLPVIYLSVLLLHFALLSAQELEDEEIVFDALDALIDRSMADLVETVLVVSEGEVDDEVSLSVLSYLTEVYSTAGFYESGYLGTPLEQRTLPYYRGPVVVSDPETDFFRPVLGGITSNFGWRPTFQRIHKGIDLSVREGESVRAALPGVVTMVSYDPDGYGNYVIVAHSGGLETRYGHLSGTVVKAGQLVEAGQTIGLGGSTGNATGPHLHFESRRYGVALDPLTVFRF